MKAAIWVGLALAAACSAAAQEAREAASAWGSSVTEAARPVKASGSRGAVAVTLLGSVVTPSPAESFALNGNLAYVCDDNEVAVVNIANPSSMSIAATALSGVIQNAGLNHCAVVRNTLSVFSDQASSLIGNNPGYSAFSLANPLQPQLIRATQINKRFFQAPVYMGNYAIVPTSANTFVGTTWDQQYGDLLSVDLTNFNAPALTGTLAQPQLNAIYGGSTIYLGATQADDTLVYTGGSTSTGAKNDGAGRLQVVDAINPAAMKIVAQRLIPGSVHFFAPLIQGTLAVGIGNTGGSAGTVNANPLYKGNIVVTTFDVSDRRSPAIMAIRTTTYKVGQGGGQTRIGNNIFAFAGVVDANNNNVLLIVDASNPLSPVIESIPIPQPFSDIEAVGTTLFATQGVGGFAAYSIPGIGGGPLTSCPVSVDAVLVVDRGMNVTSQVFADAKSALQGFIRSLKLPTDQVGVASFATAASLDQMLTTNLTQATAAFDAVIPGGESYVGAGITAAQDELTGPRRKPGSTMVMVVLSDGNDAGAPTPVATVAAANAAKAAGIKIVAVQYGAGTNSLMQTIASSSADFHLVSP